MPWYTSLSVTTAKTMVSRSMPLVPDNLHLDYLSMDLDSPFSDIIKGVYGVRGDVHGDEPRRNMPLANLGIIISYRYRTNRQDGAIHEGGFTGLVWGSSVKYVH